MASESDGDDMGGNLRQYDLRQYESRKRKLRRTPTPSVDEDDRYKPYIKPGHKRLYPDNSISEEFPVYVESSDKDERLGNRNPLQLSKIFKNVKGVHERRRVNASKIMLVFKQAAAANDFLKNECLISNNLRAYIPAASVERIGVVRFIPKETGNLELFVKLTSDAEIINVRRFMKKIDGQLIPLSTISITFTGTKLPQFVYLDNWRYKVHEYVPPVLQCYKCLKFNHSAKVCRNEQICSKCSEPHSFRDCISEILKCSNCGGDHLAISKNCPIKMAKLENNKKSYSSVLANTQSNFPPLPHKSQTKIVQSGQFDKYNLEQNPLQINDIVNNDKLLNCIIKTLVALGNDNSIKTTALIKETFIRNLHA